jgi:DNA-binding transcriptional MerR regulator
MTNPEYITIIEFARICGVSAKTLRLYDRIGLFRPAFVDPRTRYRFYLHEQLRDFTRIQAIRDCGASLAEIRGAMRGRRSPSEQKRFLEKLRNARLEAIDEARRSLAWIEGALQELDLQSPLRVTMKYCAPIAIASLRTDLKSYADIRQYERSLWAAVAPRSDCRTRGVLWHRCADKGVIDSEPFIQVKNGTVCPAAYQLKQLPGAHVARAFSSLDDDEAEAAHVGLSRWIRDRGYRLAGPRREIYRGKLLEIQYPLEMGLR